MTDHFAHLDQDPLDEILSSPLRQVPVTPPATYTENCPKCGGSGRFYGYSGRVVGNCFTCKGTGKKVFTTSPQQRAQSRQASADRRARRASEAAESFKQHHPKVWAWMSTSTHSFAQSLVLALAKYGDLTDNQLAAAQRFADREDRASDPEAFTRAFAAFEAGHPSEAAWLKSHQDDQFAQSLVQTIHRYGRLTDRQLAAVTRNVATAVRPTRVSVDASKIQSAFDKFFETAAQLGPRANSRGISPRLVIGGLKFKPAKSSGRNPGAIYVTRKDDAGENEYLGKIASGQFHASPACTDETAAEIARVAQDPEAAAVAHGRITGNCAICSRTLSRHDSITRGIGPICASRMGW